MKDITNSTMNRNKRTFHRGKQNARAQTVRAGCSMAGLLAVLALAFLTPRVAMGSVQVDVGTQTVIGNDATPQTIYLFVNNSGSPVTVGSLDFYIELGSGAGTTPSNNSGQSADPGNESQLQFYSALKASGPSGSGPVIPTGSSQLAAISFVTAGTASGSFALSLSPTVGTTDYFTDTSSPTGVGLSIVNGTLDVVAVPEPSNALAAVFMVLFAGFQTLQLRRTRTGI
jgi:hypothetical protein